MLPRSLEFVQSATLAAGNDGSTTVALYGMLGALGVALIVGTFQVLTSKMSSSRERIPSTSSKQARRNNHYDALVLFLASECNVDARKVRTGYEKLSEVQREA